MALRVVFYCRSHLEGQKFGGYELRRDVLRGHAVRGHFWCVRIGVWLCLPAYLVHSRSDILVCDAKLVCLNVDRAIEFDGGFLRKVTSCELKNVTKIRCSKDADGIGGIGFVASWFDGRIHRVRLEFGAIPHVESVEDLTRQLVDTRQDEKNKSTVK